MMTRSAAVAAAALVVLFLFLPLFDHRRAADNALPSSSLIYGRSSDAISLDPPNQWDGLSSAVINNVFENLVQFVEGSAKTEFVLAEKCEISKDLLEYTMPLRHGVKFHDGSDFNADAVVFNFERQMKKDHPYRLGNCECFESNFSVLESVRKKDDFTVVFKLRKPYTPFLEMLAMTPMAISSPDAVKRHGQSYYKNPCGTGPFRFSSWIPSDTLVIERNPGYWASPAKVEKIVFKTIPENKLRLMQLYSGLIDIMEGINPEDLDTIKRNPEITLLAEPGLNIGYIAMNNDRPPFNKREVRLAMNHAINKKAIINLFYQQTATLAKNPMPPSLIGYNDEIEGHAFDMGKAREYLKLAGLENGFSAEILVLPLTTTAFPEPDKVASAIVANLDAVGIRLKKTTCDWITYQKRMADGDYDVGMFIWVADIPDPDNFLYVLLDSDNAVKGQALNVAFYRNESLHYTLMKAQSSIEIGERESLYKKAQEIIHHDAPWINFTHANQMIAHRNYVKNLKLSPVIFECYKNVEVSR